MSGSTMVAVCLSANPLHCGTDPSSVGGGMLTTGLRRLSFVVSVTLLGWVVVSSHDTTIRGGKPHRG
jgi:hypothetical protein